VLGSRWVGSNLTPQMSPLMRIRCSGMVEMFQREWLGELHALAVPGACMAFSAIFGIGYGLRVWNNHPETSWANLVPVQLQYYLTKTQQTRIMNEGKDDGDLSKMDDYHIIFGRKQNLGPLSQPFLDVLDAKAKAAGKDGVNMSATHNRFFPKSLADNVESLVVDAVAKKVA